ncbi:hypothetical protein ACFVHQ_03800 [Actinomycetes bacterium NPDC127524]
MAIKRGAPSMENEHAGVTELGRPQRAPQAKIHNVSRGNWRAGRKGKPFVVPFFMTVLGEDA